MLVVLTIACQPPKLVDSKNLLFCITITDHISHIICTQEYFPRFPFIHAMWHCLSAASVASVNDLVKDAEEQRLLCMQATPLVL